MHFFYVRGCKERETIRFNSV